MTSHNITVTQNPEDESAARQRRQLDQYERWDSDSASDYGRDPESNHQRYRSNTSYPRRNPERRQSRSPSCRSPARTSIVVTLLDGGQTAHSAFKLKLDIHKKPGAMCTIGKKGDWLRYCKGVQS
ncbi:uncharacterized protein TNCV_3810441 [Trichonephila clavipes]|nr:uncharacterized protein TNCV_3810441 [Trichonephila clavipes]